MTSLLHTKCPELPILLVDDEPAVLASYEAILRAGGFNNLRTLGDSRKVASLLAEERVGYILLDLDMPYITGGEILTRVSAEYPEIQTLIVTGFDELEIAVRCMKAGAVDYLVKPVEESRLISALKRAIELWEARQENGRLKDQLFDRGVKSPGAFSEIITRSPRMLAIFEYVEAIAATSQPVLIVGETGVGKELIAKALHRLSKRTGSFVPVNAAGLDDHVFSDTLFGHVKGSFTGAISARGGLIERANCGTLFLDEIGDLSESSQIKLLRLLQEREYLPLGADIAKKTDARVITATNKDVRTLHTSGAFRQDLFYRLKGHLIQVPPLRERLDDIPLLLDHFVTRAAESLGRKKPRLPEDLIAFLAAYRFPGNIRELQAMVLEAVGRHRDGELSMESFKEHVDMMKSAGQKPPADTSIPLLSAQIEDRPLTLKEATDLLVIDAMVKSKGNQREAARKLGISPSALCRRLSKARYSSELSEVD